MTFTSCTTNLSFDSEKWKEKGEDWWMAGTRERMVADLISSDTLKGLNKIEVIHLLGDPELTDEGRFKYLVREKYEIDIDPVYIKYLLIEFDLSGSAAKIEVYEL